MDHVVQAATEDLGAGPAEEPLGGRVEEGDSPLEVERAEPLALGLGDGAEEVALAAEFLLVALPLGDVLRDPYGAFELALGAQERGGVEEQGQRPVLDLPD